MWLWNRLSDSLRPFNKPRIPTLAGHSDGEHRALEELYEESDGSAPWLTSLLVFTASHLKCHRLSRRERRSVNEALSTYPAIGLNTVESIHDLVHGGAYKFHGRVSSTIHD